MDKKGATLSLSTSKELHQNLLCFSSSIKLSKNPVLHGRCKHIDVRYHFLSDLTKDGTIELVHCTSENQMTDIFTKPLKLESLCKLKCFSCGPKFVELQH